MTRDELEHAIRAAPDAEELAEEHPITEVVGPPGLSSLPLYCLASD